MRMAWRAAGVGLIAVVALLAACGGSGDSSSDEGGFELDPAPTPLGACASVLPPLTADAPTAESFAAADEGVARTIELAEADDLVGATEVFFSSAHDLTHDIDGPLQEVNAPLKITLCNEVLQMEQELAGEMDAKRAAELGRGVQELLVMAREALGLAD